MYCSFSDFIRKTLDIKGSIAHHHRPAYYLFDSNNLTFKGLTNQNWLNLISSILKTIRCHKSQRIIICAKAGPFANASMIATWISGGYFIPVNPDVPIKLLQEIIEAIDPDLILSETGVVHFEAIKQNITCPIYFENQMNYESSNHLVFQERPKDSIAYVITTSGSTGSPKLIPIMDSNLISYINNLPSFLPTQQPEVIFQTFPISFDPSLEDIIWSLLFNAPLAPLSLEDTRFIDSYLQWDNMWWCSTPSLASLIITFLRNKGELSTKITHSFFMGEPLTKELIVNWSQWFPNTSVYNLYGPAECTITITYKKVNLKDLGSTNQTISIGSIHPQHHFIINDLQELMISGPQVFDGYLMSNGQHLVKVGDRLYFNTHDLCKEQNGELYYLGRSDFVDKVKGQRIDPLDIELYLRNQGIIGFIVISEISTNTKTKIISFITQDHNLTLQHLREILKDRFNTAVLPTRLFWTETFPLNNSQKVDRTALLNFVRNKF